MLRALGWSLLGTLVLSCLVTPIVYAAFEAWMTDVPWPYSRVFDRVVLVLLVAWFVILRKELEFSQLRPYWVELARPGPWKLVVIGGLFTLTVSLLMLPLVVHGGTLIWHPNRTTEELIRRGISLVPSALVIALIEESLFRLILFEGLRDRLTTAGAALGSSALYASVHFVSPDKDFLFPGWSPLVGFEYLGAMGTKFMQPGVPQGLIGLTLVGLTLCAAISRGRSLALCVGLHAGWILAAKLAMKIARRAPGVEFPTGAGRRNYLVTQPVVWGTVVLVLIVVWWSCGRGSDRTPKATKGSQAGA